MRLFRRRTVEEIDREMRRGCGKESNWSWLLDAFFPPNPEKVRRRHLKLAAERKGAALPEGFSVAEWLPRHDWM